MRNAAFSAVLVLLLAQHEAIALSIVRSSQQQQHNSYYNGRFASKMADAQYLHPAHGRRLSAATSRRALLAEEPAKTEIKASDLGLARLQSQVVDCKPAGAGIEPDPVLCTFKNLVLWNGDVLFVGPEAPPTNVEWAVKDLQVGGAKIVKSVSQLGVPDSAPAARVPLAGLVTPYLYSNFMSVVGIMMPNVHHVLCEHFEHCSHEPERNPQLFLTNTETLREGGDRIIRADWTQCLSRSPVLARNASSLAGEVVLLETAFMLFDAGCVTPAGQCTPWQYRTPPHKDDAMAPWRNRMAACLGFDPLKGAPRERLNILLVDRDYWAGRKILNINEMVRDLNQRYPMANITVIYPERLPLAEQAHAYNDATVIIWVTGASMVNLLFAPHGAVAMHMGMKEFPSTPYDEAAHWVDKVVPINIEMQQCKTTNPDRIVLRAYWVFKNPDYEALTDEEKLGIWELKVCPKQPGDRVNQLCEDVWIAKGGEFEMELGILWDATGRFMPRVVEQYEKARGQTA